LPVGLGAIRTLTWLVTILLALRSLYRAFTRRHSNSKLLGDLYFGPTALHTSLLSKRKTQISQWLDMTEIRFLPISVGRPGHKANFVLTEDIFADKENLTTRR
jgi:hypothetical protein